MSQRQFARPVEVAVAAVAVQAIADAEALEAADHAALPAPAFPSLRSALISIASLIFLYIPAGCLAVHYATPETPWILAAIAAACSLAIATSVAFDTWPLFLTRPRNGHGATYRRNLANTVLTIFTTIIFTCILFIYVWCPARNTWVLETSTEMKTEIPYPAFAIVSDYPAPFQANLIAPQKCNIGNKDVATHCSSLTSAQVAGLGDNGLAALKNATACNCTDSWTPTVAPNFLGSDGKPTLHFRPAANLVAGSVQTFMGLYFSFNINTTQWSNQSYVNGPSVWILVYDASIPFETAYKSGSGAYLLAAVDAATVLTLSPTLLKRRDSPAPIYTYGVTLSKAASAGVTCDLGDKLPSPTGAYADCWGTFLVRVQSFEASVATEVRAMGWGAFGESLGGFFALVGFCCWLLSGLAVA